MPISAPDSADYPLVGPEPALAASLTRPPAIAKGEAIGVVAPSYSPREGQLTRGVKALERAGYTR